MVVMLGLIWAAATTTETEVPSWLAPFIAGGAANAGLVGVLFLMNKVKSGADFTRVIGERDAAYERERKTQEYVRDSLVPAVIASTEATTEAMRLVKGDSR